MKQYELRITTTDIDYITNILTQQFVKSKVEYGHYLITLEKGKKKGNEHVHAYLESTISEKGLRVRLQKAGYKGKYSLQSVVNKDNYLAYISKDHDKKHFKYSTNIPNYDPSACAAKYDASTDSKKIVRSNLDLQYVINAAINHFHMNKISLGSFSLHNKQHAMIVSSISFKHHGKGIPMQKFREILLTLSIEFEGHSKYVDAALKYL